MKLDSQPAAETDASDLVQGVAKTVAGVSRLLDDACANLTQGVATPGLRCPELLKDVEAQLRPALTLLKGSSASTSLTEMDRSDLRKQLSALTPQLSRLNSLFASADEFYRGWCSPSVPSPQYTTNGYETASWSNICGPALIAYQA